MPLYRRLACFVNISVWIKTVGYSLENTISFFIVACKKVQNVILIIYDAGTENKHTFHPEGTLSAFLKRLRDYFEFSSAGRLLSEHQGETDIHSLCFCWCWFLMCTLYQFVPMLGVCVCEHLLSGLLSEPDAGAWYDKSLRLQTDRCSSSDSDLSIEHGCENKAVSCDYAPSIA